MKEAAAAAEKQTCNGALHHHTAAGVCAAWAAGSAWAAGAAGAAGGGGTTGVAGVTEVAGRGGAAGASGAAEAAGAAGPAGPAGAGWKPSACPWCARLPDDESRVLSRRSNGAGDVRMWCPRASDLAGINLLSTHDVEDGCGAGAGAAAGAYTRPLFSST